ncbi:MAG: hypothetical protein IPP49_04710 [Saprospiraceae bacterium]|nr:hypothetical protein [Saprospiraceae bacterium]
MFNFIFLTYHAGRSDQRLSYKRHYFVQKQQNIYVRFQTTESILVGDTLSLFYNGQWQKALVVKQKSTTSCVTENLIPNNPDIGQAVQFITKGKRGYNK